MKDYTYSDPLKVPIQNLFSDQKTLFQEFQQTLFQRALLDYYHADQSDFFMLQKRHNGLFFATNTISSSQTSSTNILEDAQYDLLAGFLSKEDISNPTQYSNFHGLRVSGVLNQHNASMSFGRDISYYLENMLFNYKNISNPLANVKVKYSGLEPFVDGDISQDSLSIQTWHNLDGTVNFNPKIMELMNQGILRTLPNKSGIFEGRGEYTGLLLKELRKLKSNNSLVSLTSENLTSIEFQSSLMEIVRKEYFE